VHSLLKPLGKAAGLSTPSTAGPKYLTSQVFLSSGFLTGFEQPGGSFAQAKKLFFNLLGRALYTPSTGPTDNTNLIKGI
jgi:hypothetical protein